MYYISSCLKNQIQQNTNTFNKAHLLNLNYILYHSFPGLQRSIKALVLDVVTVFAKEPSCRLEKTCAMVYCAYPEGFSIVEKLKA